MRRAVKLWFWRALVTGTVNLSIHRAVPATKCPLPLAYRHVVGEAHDVVDLRRAQPVNLALVLSEFKRRPKRPAAEAAV